MQQSPMVQTVGNARWIMSYTWTGFEYTVFVAAAAEDQAFVNTISVTNKEDVERMIESYIDAVAILSIGLRADSAFDGTPLYKMHEYVTNVMMTDYTYGWTNTTQTFARYMGFVAA